MDVSFPSGLKESCKYLESCYYDEDITNFCDHKKIIDICLKRRASGVLEYYYLINERWKEARYNWYYMIMLNPSRINRNFYNYTKDTLLFINDTLRDDIRHPIEDFRRAIDDEYGEILTNHILLYPFEKDALSCDNMTKRAHKKWLSRFQEERNKSFIKSWDEAMSFSYPAWTQYVMLSFCVGDIQAIEDTISEYCSWLEWWKKQKKKPDYKLVWQRGFTANYKRPYPDPSGRPQILLPLLSEWLEARKSEGSREKAARRLMRLFHRWFYVEYNREASSCRGPLYLQIILSIVMRIDLGVDLDNCREFARYFYPFLTCFPHIREKLEALDVEYEPPRVYTKEECKIIYDKAEDKFVL